MSFEAHEKITEFSLTESPCELQSKPSLTKQALAYTCASKNGRKKRICFNALKFKNLEFQEQKNSQMFT
jgi:hypothetical protein